MPLLFLVTPVIAYLLGAVNGAILISVLMKLPSPRTIGSGNPGATNMLRGGNKIAAGLTLVFDVLKGVIAVMLAIYLHQPPWLIALCGLAAVLGHMYPVFFNFRGGKGVATAIGVILAINPLLAMLVIVSFLIVLMLFRYVSLASITSALLCPLYAYFLLPITAIPTLMAISLFITFRHHHNIKRLRSGKEPKIWQKKT